MDTRTFAGTSGLADDGLALALAPALTPDGVREAPSFFHGFATHPQVLARGRGRPQCSRRLEVCKLY